MAVENDDALFFARMVRHAALGALIGGPIAAGLGWMALSARGQMLTLTDQGAGQPLVLIVIITALLVGVWVGATIGCSVRMNVSAEQKCYGGGLGCLINIIGGALGLFLGPRLVASPVHPVIWYMIGATLLGIVALGFTVSCPQARRVARRD